MKKMDRLCIFNLAKVDFCIPLEDCQSRAPEKKKLA